MVEVTCPLLEIEPETELYLSWRAEPNPSFDGRPQQAKRRTGSTLCKRLARLNYVRGACRIRPGRRVEAQRRQRIIQCRRRIGKVRMVKDVEDLGTKFEIHRLCKFEPLVQDQVRLPKARARERVSRQIAERSGFRYRERSRIDEVAVVVQERVDA